MHDIVGQLIVKGAATLRGGIAYMPFWAEEVAICGAIAMLYMIVHCSMMFIRKECRGATNHHKVLGEEPMPLLHSFRQPGAWLFAQWFYGSKAEGPTLRRVSPPQPQATAHTPKTSRELPGVTDRRFTGVIVSYKPEEGYGFIQCPELHDIFGRDVFLHRLQIGCFDVGDFVSFSVFLNKNSQPQAKELGVPQRPADEGLATVAATVRPLAAAPDTMGCALQKTRRLPPKPLPQQFQQQWQEQQQQRQNDPAVATPMSAATAASMVRCMQGRPTWEELMMLQPPQSEELSDVSKPAWLASSRSKGESHSTVRNRTAATAY